MVKIRLRLRLSHTGVYILHVYCIYIITKQPHFCMASQPRVSVASYAGEGGREGGV